MSAAKTAHVVAFAFPFGSHPTPLLHLVQRLAAAAPNVRFSYFNTKKSNQNVFSKVNLHLYDNIKAYDVGNGVPEGHAFSGNPLEEIDLFIEATPENFRRRLVEVVEETGLKATCLLTDAFLWFSSEMAAEMGISWVAFWTAGPAPISIHLYTDVIHRRLGQNGKTQNQDDQTLDFLPGMSAIRTSDLPQELLYLNTPFSRLLHNMSRALPRAAAVVLNSFDGLDPVVENDLKSKLQKILNVGPFPLPSPTPPSDDQSGCLSWLSDHPTASVAYLSFGTMLTPPPHELVALAEALEEKQIPYLWSFRDKSKTNILQGFFERTTRSIGKIVDWAPQLQVLAHSSVGVFVTHGGWNSVVESIAAGVPMICRPFFGDQMMNRRCVEAVWRIGVGVEGGIFTKSGVAAALNLVLFEEEGKKMKENIGKLRESALNAVAENGSSTENFKSLVAIATSSHQD